VKPFEAPQESLGDLNAVDAASVIATAADIALIIDEGGVIRDLAFGGKALPLEGLGRWRGQRWTETVTVESRPKIEALLRDAASHHEPRGRQVNHPSSSGGDVPVVYAAVQVSETPRVVALGRDLRDVAALQQRVVNAQQSMERDYLRLRQVETRYRLLFQMMHDALLIVDAVTLKVVEANPAVAALLGDGKARLTGQFLEAFDTEGARAIQNLLAGAQATGQPDKVSAQSADGKQRYRVSVTPFRQDGASLFLVRMAADKPDTTQDEDSAPARARLAAVIEHAADGLIVTDGDGQLLSANKAFLELAQLTAESQAVGESVERWLGRPGVDFGVLKSNLRQHGSVKLFATTLHGEHGADVQVEISAAAVTSGGRPCFGFSIRDVGRRLVPGADTSRELPRSVQELTELVSRVPLKDLVRETTDVIERLCIEAALELTGDNRASAAEMLGLSRQSLYAKLRRHGLGDLDAGAGAQKSDN
jgi:transcriptional regulator PpsR